MSDDPVTLLNLREEPGSTGRQGRWWVAALVVPPVVFGLGILAAFTLPRNDLGSAIWLAVAGLGLAALLCVACATVSVAKKEAGRFWAIFAALPCVALLVWGMSLFGQAKYGEWKRQQEAKEREVYFQQIRADPGIGLREHWAGPENLMKVQVFRDSLRDPRVNYTPEQLERIYAEVPSLRQEVLEHRSCTPEFLTAHFPDAVANAKQYSYPMLSAIIQHPNTPLPLLETITLDPKLPAQRDAKYVLERRKPRPPPPKPKPEAPPLLVLGIPKYDFDNDSTPPAQRFARFQRYQAAAAGKYVGLRIQSLPIRSLPDGREIPAPRTISLSVAGMYQLMEKEDYRNVYFLPENFSFEGEEAMKLASLAMAFAIEHNEKLAKQRGDRWLDDSPAPAAKPAGRAAPAPAKPAASIPPRAPQPAYQTYRRPAAEYLAQWRKYEASAEGKYICVMTLSPRYRILADGRQEQYPSRSTIRMIPGTNFTAEKMDPYLLYPLGEYFTDDTPDDAQLLKLAIEFATQHNQRVLSQVEKK